jgi:hypothetical protein
VVYLRGDTDKDLRPTLFDPRTGKRTPLSAALPPGPYSRPAFSADGGHVALVRAGTEVVEVDVATGTVGRRFEHEGDQIARVTYSGADWVIVRSAWVGDLWAATLP